MALVEELSNKESMSAAEWAEIGMGTTQNS
jgi:hypothetical protein